MFQIALMIFTMSKSLYLSGNNHSENLNALFLIIKHHKGPFKDKPLCWTPKISLLWISNSLLLIEFSKLLPYKLLLILRRKKSTWISSIIAPNKTKKINKVQNICNNQFYLHQKRMLLQIKNLKLQLISVS